MEDSEVQLSETVLNSGKSHLYDDVGSLILEELRCFRKEMREEVRKLNSNVQNFLFSKADIVNALLGTSTLFTEIEQSINHTPLENLKNFADTQAQVQKTDTSFQKPIIKFHPTTVLKSQPGEGQRALHKVPVLKQATKAFTQTIPKMTLSTTCQKMTEIMTDFTSPKETTEKPMAKMKMQLLHYNGQSQNSDVKESSVVSATDGKIFPVSEIGQRSLLHSQKFISLNKTFKRKNSIEALSSKSQILPHHAYPKLPTKHSQHMSKLYYPKHNMLIKHKCKFCGKCFSSSNDLKRHLSIHTGDRPFKCKACTKAYTRNDHLRRHIKQKHSVLHRSSVMDTSLSVMDTSSSVMDTSSDADKSESVKKEAADT